MALTQADTLKEQMMKNNPVFHELAMEHSQYEKRLSELAALSYPTPREQLEETVLKKKKLALKDRMQTMLSVHQREASSGHWSPRN